jgi:hypothetical protein
MNEKQLQLVTYEQAKALKELGFSWNTSFYYLFDHDEDGTDKYDFIDFIDIKSAGIYGFDLFETNHNAKDGHFSAPTVALALKWMRDVKGIDSGILPSCDNKYFTAVPMEGSFTTAKYFKYYEEAESAILDEIIKHLKSKEK